jgi:amino acid transporter
MLTLPLPTQAARRRAVVLLWTAFAAYLAANTLTRGDDLAGAMSALAMLVGIGCLFSVARAVRWGHGCAAGLDEREMAARDRAHYLAFRVQSWLTLAVVAYTTVAVRVDALWLPATGHQAAGAVAAVAVAMGLLPVTCIGWGEPDFLLDDEEPAMPRQSIRFPLPHRSRMIIAAMLAVAGTLALLALAGVGPVPAEEADTMAGLATGMLVGFLATRSADRERA